MMTKILSQQRIAERHAFAIALARRAGEEAARFQQKASPEEMNVSVKGRQDFVTVADRHAETMIKTALASAFPTDGFFGEESGGVLGAGPVWVVDPIDGTSNYLRGLPSWGVSIALVEGETIQVGVIYDATRNAVFHAALGGGAFADDKPIAASGIADPERALAILGHSRRTPFAAYLEILAGLYAAGIDYRRLGAASLGLLRVADGKAELYYEAHLNSWDALAGILIAREAGAILDVPDVATLLREGGPVLAVAPHLVAALPPIFPDGAGMIS